MYMLGDVKSYNCSVQETKNNVKMNCNNNGPSKFDSTTFNQINFKVFLDD